MVRILFVCHGNICRSVSAQYILQDMVNQAGKTAQFEINSAATSREELGNSIYPPMAQALVKAGIPVGTHSARQLTRKDSTSWDHLIGMDDENLHNMRRMLDPEAAPKLHYLMDFAGKPGAAIADPWYTRKFDECVAELSQGCAGLLKTLLSKNS